MMDRNTLILRSERLSLWALSMFAVAAVASIVLQNFVFLALAAWLLGMGFSRRWRLLPTPVNTPLLLLGLVLVAASLWAGRLNPSFFGLRKVGLMAVFFLTAAMVRQPVKADRLLNLFLLGATICALGSIAVHLLGWDDGRAHSFSGDYMAAGGMYMLAFVLTLARFLYQSERPQWYWLGCAGVLGLALLFTYTRSSWIGAALALLFLGMVRDWRLPVGLLAAVVFLLVVFPNNPVSQRVFTLTSKYHSSNVERKYMWASAVKLIKASPVLGYGVDNLSEVYGPVANPQALEQRPPHVHNTLMQLAVNGGLPAAGFYLWWVIAVIGLGLSAWRKNRELAVQRSGTAIGITAAFIAFVANGLFEFNFGTSQVITIVYFLIGLLPAFAMADPREPECPPLPGQPRLLFIRPRFLGDVLLASAIPRLIKRDYPKARVDLLTEPGNAGAAGGNAGWDQVIPLARSNILTWRQTIRNLRRENYDVVCDLFGNPRTALLAYLSGARLKVGPQVKGWGLLFHIQTAPGQTGPRPAWESYFDILRCFGLKQLSQRPRWEVAAADLDWAKAFLKARHAQPGKVIGMFAGASHPAKRWPLPYFMQLAKEVTRQLGFKAIFVFGPLEHELKTEYIRLAGKLTLCAENLTPGKLAALWSLCAAVVSNDAFPMHMGPAVNIPTIGLFGPGEPAIWFPYPEKSGHRALHVPQDCWPCHRDECFKTKCWDAIAPGQVLDALRVALAPARRGAVPGQTKKTQRSQGMKA